VFTGDLATGTSLVEEARSVSEMTGSALMPYGEVGLLAVRGNAEQVELLVRQYQHDSVTTLGEGIGMSTVQWARAVLGNGLGRYEEAFRAAQDAVAPSGLGPSGWALAELVEAGVRTGDRGTAVTAFQELSAMTRASGTEWALGLEAGRRALLSHGAAADLLYREAIDRLSRTTVRVELARARLLYGEWLRREGRRVDARVQLRDAHEVLRAIGAEGFAERARHELQATGETVRKRSLTTAPTLTGQEARIARLAADGCTNREIGALLYVSHRTVEWHLRKIFDKLGVTARRELRRAVQGLPEP
jgi:DNA-binding CsgD family transcriptional regulator